MVRLRSFATMQRPDNSDDMEEKKMQQQPHETKKPWNKRVWRASREFPIMLVA